MYFAKFFKYLSSRINYCRILSLHKERQRFISKNKQDIYGGPSIEFTRNTVMDDTFIRDSTNWCETVVGIDASHIHPFSMYQETGLYTIWEPNSEYGKFTPRQNKMSSFENMVISYFQRVRPQCKVENFYTTGAQKKIDAYSVDGFCGHCNTEFERIGCYYQNCPNQEARRSH